MTWAPSVRLRRQWAALSPGKLAAPFAFAMALLFGAAAQAQQFDYSAVLASQGRINGPVNAGGIVWQCNAKYCTTRGPWPVPGVKSCNALAMIVGPLTSYGYKGRMLSPSDMATCNGKQTTAAKPAIVPVNPLGALLQNLGGNNQPGLPGSSPPPSPLPGFGQQAAIAGTGSATIRTMTLTVTGTAFLPNTVRTAAIQASGTDAGWPPLHVTIRTVPLSVTGPAP